MDFPERNHLETMANSEDSKSLVLENCTVSAPPTLASKTTTPRKKKILGERNGSDTYSTDTENLGLKPCKAEKMESCELDLSPDPMKNYPSPRPVYLRYNPNQRQEIFVKLEKEAEEGKKSVSDLSSCLNIEVEGEEEDYGSDDEIEDEEGGESYRSTWKELLVKSLFVFVALVLCSSYICTQNGGTQKLSPRVENFTSQGLSSFNALRSGREEGNRMFLVLFEDEGKRFYPNMPEVEAGSDVSWKNEEAEPFHNSMVEESEFEHETEILERNQGSIDGASEVMLHIANTQLKLNAEQVIEKNDVTFRPLVGVLISSLVFASLVVGVCLIMHKKTSVSHASSETKTLQVESVLEDEMKGDPVLDDMCMKPCDSFTNKIPSHSMEEFDRVSYHSRVPVIELLGELEIGEASISSQRRSRISQGKESIHSASLEQSRLMGEPEHSGLSGLSSGNSASNGSLLNDKRSKRTICQENNWTEGHSRKEANATPLRRSSRIRNRWSVQSP